MKEFEKRLFFVRLCVNGILEKEGRRWRELVFTEMRFSKVTCGFRLYRDSS